MRRNEHYQGMHRPRQIWTSTVLPCAPVIQHQRQFQLIVHHASKNHQTSLWVPRLLHIVGVMPRRFIWLESFSSSLYTQNGHSTSIRRAYRGEVIVLGTIHESSPAVRHFLFTQM